MISKGRSRTAQDTCRTHCPAPLPPETRAQDSSHALAFIIILMNREWVWDGESFPVQHCMPPHCPKRVYTWCCEPLPLRTDQTNATEKTPSALKVKAKSCVFFFLRGPCLQTDRLQFFEKAQGNGIDCTCRDTGIHTQQNIVKIGVRSRSGTVLHDLLAQDDPCCCG